MSAASATRARILQVGTDRLGLDMRSVILSTQGYQVTNCSNGFEAIRAAAVERVHVVLIDLDRDGSEMTLIAQEIKRVRPEVPTIVLTERATPENKIPELCRLADELVPKEQGPEAILMSVRRVLGKQASASITRAK